MNTKSGVTETEHSPLATGPTRQYLIEGAVFFLAALALISFMSFNSVTVAKSRMFLLGYAPLLVLLSVFCSALAPIQKNVPISISWKKLAAFGYALGLIVVFTSHWRFALHDRLYLEPLSNGNFRDETWRFILKLDIVFIPLLFLCGLMNTVGLLVGFVSSLKQKRAFPMDVKKVLVLGGLLLVLYVLGKIAVATFSVWFSTKGGTIQSFTAGLVADPILVALGIAAMLMGYLRRATASRVQIAVVFSYLIGAILFGEGLRYLTLAQNRPAALIVVAGFLLILPALISTGLEFVRGDSNSK
jgi:hypothetical protein